MVRGVLEINGRPEATTSKHSAGNDLTDDRRKPDEDYISWVVCKDLVHCLRMISDKSIEWGETVWMASTDLEKAFDNLVHSAVLAGL